MATHALTAHLWGFSRARHLSPARKTLSTRLVLLYSEMLGQVRRPRLKSPRKEKTMRVVERAWQIWPALALAARNRQTLTYDMLSNLIGVARQGLGQLLEPIQSYCLVHELPPLTILVVRDDTGIPGTGFIGAENIPQNQQEVFKHNWLDHGAPTIQELQEALDQRP